ncbi:ATP synthase epsilon chain, sodium ion specific [Rubripirellula tenax]|uniref:ATP synthase epsilon chain n=1 Tax=Rubripirellula tenax TaxID=2528015 RepID=A0A5C6EIB3_9BACT|nr:ATP synthase F1 subunit epsilon [Rubripirellula tenax]TWU47391.1 ATP synthase epsilon chain, sodium ion specific [Rubripirellula tenax]
MASLRCVVVTPEKTALNREADYISLPMDDGELGVLKGRAPMIGRLGFGTLRLQTAAGPERYYVDGGFAQVEDNVVNILTGKLIPVDLIDNDKAREELNEARTLPSSKLEDMAIKQLAIRKARGKVRASS